MQGRTIQKVTTDERRGFRRLPALIVAGARKFESRGDANLANEFVNKSFLHAVKCEWCGRKMFCNCWDGNDPNRQGHIVVLCPRCQVTNFLNLLFGEQDLRSVLLARVREAKTGGINATSGPGLH